MSPEMLKLYLSLEPEDRQEVDAKIHALVSADEIQFLSMVNDADVRPQLLSQLERLDLLPSFLAAEGGADA